MNTERILGYLRIALGNPIPIANSFRSGNYDGAYEADISEKKKTSPNFYFNAYLLGYYSSYEDHEVPEVYRDAVADLRIHFAPALSAIGICCGVELTDDQERLIRVAKGAYAVQRAGNGVAIDETDYAAAIANILHAYVGDRNAMINRAFDLFSEQGGKFDASALSEEAIKS